MKQTAKMAWYMAASRRRSLLKRASLLLLHACPKMPIIKLLSTLHYDITGKVIFPRPNAKRLAIGEIADFPEITQLSEEHITKIQTEYIITVLNDQYIALDWVDSHLRLIGLSVDLTVPPFYRYDFLIVYDGDIENFPGQKFSTTYGRYVANYYQIAANLIHDPKNVDPLLKFRNETWNIDKFEGGLTELLMDHKLDVEPVNKYVDFAYFLSSIGEICGATLTKKAVIPDPAIAKRRDELYKKYEGQLSDPRISTIIENELIAMDKDALKGDPSMAFLGDSGKKFNVHRKRQYIAVGLLEEFSKSKGKYEFIKESLSDGWNKNSFKAICDEIRRGSFDRGVETQVAGLDTKWMVAVFQNCKITGHDCESKQTLSVTPTAMTINSYIGAYMKSDQKLPVKMISFPKEEWERIQNQKIIYTTRISDDKDKYKIGDLVLAPWGKHYNVIDRSVFDDVAQHPFKKDLTPTQIDLLTGKQFAVLKLVLTDVIPGYQPITRENCKSLVGQTIQIRSMQYCKQPYGFCEVCAGKSFMDLDFTNIGTIPIDIGAVFLALSMKSMHGTKIDSFRIETPEALDRYFI